ncbi:hybrid sensor histidine kinase/response regulator transcription factor [Saccharicrinis sp. GN24d3]|uniref:hybrid sensor histidine kinase/response regulator transcription factor n=1 Tax=Saccharicrinis sp. GN24d3 TaxID=3458416 RepID=UPI0040356723
MRNLILVLILICQCYVAKAVSVELDLMHWDVSSGLPDDDITCFAQDDKGFIWIGTVKGLVRFDGHNFILFDLPQTSQSELLARIYSRDKELVLVTNKQTCYLFDTEYLKFTKIDGADPRYEDLCWAGRNLFLRGQTPASNDSIYINEEGALFVGGKTLSGKYHAAFKASTGRLWLGPSEGLSYLNDSGFGVTSVGQLSLMPRVKVDLITEGEDGKIWFAMDLGGIGFWDNNKQELITAKNVVTIPTVKNGYQVLSDLIGFDITSLFFDNNGNLWIGTKRNGMFRVRFTHEFFQHFKFDYRSSTGLAHLDISFPLSMSNGDIWLGTWGEGVNLLKKEDLNIANPNFVTFSPQAGIRGAIQQGDIYPLLEDHSGNLWMGTYGKGIHFLSKKNRTTGNYWFKNYSEIRPGKFFDPISALCEDKSGGIWAGTIRGLYQFDSSKDKFQALNDDCKDLLFLKDKYILWLYEGRESELWISTASDGLFLWDRKKKNLKQFRTGDTRSLSGIRGGIFMNDSAMWFAGANGIFHFNPKTDQFLSLSKNVVLPSNYIESMLLGDDSRLWMGTKKGLLALDPDTRKFEVFHMHGGGLSNSFTQGVSKDEKGYMYFGSRNGFYRFHPSELNVKKKEVTVILTDLKIHGKSFRNDSVLFFRYLKGKDISSINHLNLKYNQNTITIGYSNMDFSPNDVHEYEVHLEGEEDSWSGTFDSYQTWSKLRSGNYIFHVKLKGQEQETVLPISIASPWWKTTWFYISLFLFSSFVLTLLLLLVNKRVIAKEKLHQKETYDRLRFRFFLNVSHEIRTPLTLIKGGVDRMIEHGAVRNEFAAEMERVAKNTERLTRLVNEVLDLKNIENKNVSVKNHEFNLKEFLVASVDVFKLRDDRCRLVLKMPKSPVWIVSDREMIETIIYNLLSNAFKYSPQNSDIIVELNHEKNEKAWIKVTDHGSGIRKEDQQRIFERFYRSENQMQSGTGIGLALVKQYADLLGGSVKVDSELGQGSTFTLFIPDKREKEKLAIEKEKRHVLSSKIADDRPVLVIVDDHPDIRDFVREIFVNEYLVFEAIDGKNGLALIKEKSPDLIISDVMMPEMNGYELCEAIRSDIAISHIPIVLLTAKTDEEAQMSAFASSADAFINKPFNQKILKIRVDKLIEQRKKLIQKYGDKPEETTMVLATTQLDKEFVEKMETILMERIEDVDFNVEELASQMAMSTSGLYRKIKALTSKSPVEYIRIHRLKEAAKLLKETTFSVTEVSEKTGFSNQKYFSKCFKHQFNITPLNYRKKG